MGWLLIATEEGDIGRKAKGRSEVEIDLCAGGLPSSTLNNFTINK